MRNFQLTHYLLNNRIGDAFWDGCRNQSPPASLAEKIRLFEHTGYVSIREFETFQEENWITLLNGHGIKPQGYHPLVDEIPEQDLMNQFVHLLKKVKHRVEALQKRI